MVSHGQATLVNALLGDFAGQCRSTVEVVLTQNIPEAGADVAADCPFPVRVVRNERPQGFGANHNAAFALSKGRYFCVLNPDVRLRGDPFPLLRSDLGDKGTGVVAPRVVSPAGVAEDNARPFPTIVSLARKALFGAAANDRAGPGPPEAPDWVAGMFMLFRRDTFERVGGFDDRFFLYYEDVDICARLRQAGYAVRIEPGVTVIHDARRQSHRSLKYARWHLASMARYLARRYTGYYR